MANEGKDYVFIYSCIEAKDNYGQEGEHEQCCVMHADSEFGITEGKQYYEDKNGNAIGYSETRCDVTLREAMFHCVDAHVGAVNIQLHSNMTKEERVEANKLYHELEALEDRRIAARARKQYDKETNRYYDDELNKDIIAFRKPLANEGMEHIPSPVCDVSDEPDDERQYE